MATLKGAFDKDCFEKLDEEVGIGHFKCDGNHPFRHTREKCSCYPKTVQRGASSVYFPLVHSSLVIPPYADQLNVKIQQMTIPAKGTYGSQKVMGDRSAFAPDFEENTRLLHNMIYGLDN